LVLRPALHLRQHGVRFPTSPHSNQPGNSVAIIKKFGKYSFTLKNKKDYLEWLKVKIEGRHNCDVTYRETVSVQAVLNGKTVWPREVEVFDLVGHSTAKRAYAWGSPAAYEWSHFDESDEFIRAFVFLELPPVDSAQKAVQMQIEEMVKDLRQAKKDFKQYMDDKFSKPFPPTN